MKKRLLSILLCLLTLASMTIGALAAGFSDVKSDAYYAKPVEWAVEQGITAGKGDGTFAPNDTCTRAHILTFLWRAAGSPVTTAFSINPYADIQEDAYYYQAALWAKTKGMVQGASFAPSTLCTRAATVEYFWKFAGCEEVDNVSFSDVSAGTDLAKAVSWAVDYGITNGTTTTTFAPNNTCTRGQIVTFLYRYFVEPLDNSAFIQSLTKPAAPAETMKLDPLPPVDYSKQSDWYMALTRRDTMSNARLAAEYDQIEDLIDDWRAKNIFITDSVYARQNDLWSEMSQRVDIVDNYDRGVRQDNLSDRKIQAYNDLIAKYGDAEVLRAYIGKV